MSAAWLGWFAAAGDNASTRHQEKKKKKHENID